MSALAPRWNTPLPLAVLAAVGVLVLPGLTTPVNPPVASALDAPRASLLQVPLYFEPNQGQTDDRVRYLARGPGYGIYLTEHGATLTLSATDNPDARPRIAHLSQRLLGANPSPRIEGIGQLEGKTHYMVGSDPKTWHTDLPNYAQVRYAEVYPGIDLVYYGAPRKLEYDFVVAPGADPDEIRFTLSGAQRVRLGAQGDLVLGFGQGDVVQHRPVVYQQIEGRRLAVEGAYEISRQDPGSVEVRFRIGDYDPNHTLVIDPIVSYASYLGGGESDTPANVAVDASGAVYVVGTTTSGDFPTTAGALDTSGVANEFAAFVTKIAANGTRVYSTYLGNRGTAASGIAVDSSGNAYIAGTTNDTDFPKTAGVFQTTLRQTDGFVSKLNAAGNALLYSTLIGGSLVEDVRGIALDGAGKAIVGGLTDSTDFPGTAGKFQPALAGARDVFVAKLNADATALEFATYLGGTGDESRMLLAINSSAEIHVAGFTQSANFPMQSAFDPTLNGTENSFVSRLSSDGTTLSYSSYYGSSGQILGLAVDGSGNTYIAGTAVNGGIPTTGDALKTGTNAGRSDAFYAVVSGTGTLDYSSYFGGTENDLAQAIAVDSGGRIYLFGRTNSTNFPTEDPSQAAKAGREDLFVTRFTNARTTLNYSTYLGGSSDDTASAMAIDSSGNAYLVGVTESDDFPTVSAFQGTRGSPSGTVEGYVVKLDGSPTPSSLKFSLESYPTIEDNGSVVLTVTRTGNAASAVSVDFATTAGTATAGSDYTTTSGSLSWTNGETASKTITVPLLNDSAKDGSKSFTVTLSNVNGATLGNPSVATVTITDDESVAGKVRVAVVSQTVSESAGKANITLQRFNGSSGAVSVRLNGPNDGSTASASDTREITLSDVVTWNDGESGNKIFELPIVDDTTAESDEVYKFSIVDGTNGAEVVDPREGTITITNNDVATAGTFELVVVKSGFNRITPVSEGGSTTATVQRKFGTAGAASVRIRTSNGTAVSGADYTAVDQVLTWADGDATDRLINLQAAGDSLVEGDETFNVALSEASGGVLGETTSAVITIIDQNAGVAFSASGYSVEENIGDTQQDASAIITLVRAGNTTGAVSVTLATSNGTATAGADYVQRQLQVSWQAGDSNSKTVQIPILDDAAEEGDETVQITLSNPNGTALGTPSTATLTIRDNENPVTGLVELTSTAFGGSEQSRTGTIRAQRIGRTQGAATANISIAGATATAGDDFSNVGVVTLNWADGEGGEKTYVLPIVDDTLVEGAETVSVTLVGSTGALLGSRRGATVTIADNDVTAAGLIRFVDRTGLLVRETDAVARVRVERAEGESGAAAVQVTTENDSALAGEDYAATQQTLSWADGETGVKTLDIPLINDTRAEANETFNVRLSNVTGAVLGSPALLAVAIADDDTVPVGGKFSIQAADVSEGAGNAIVSVTRTGGSQGEARVRVSVTSAAAVAGTDFTSVIQTLFWNDGESGSKTVSVPIVDDSEEEMDETVSYALGNAVGAEFDFVRGGTFRILDNDDRTPNAIEFRSVRGAVPLSKVLSNVVTIAGISSTIAISVSEGAEYRINDTAFTAAAGTVSNGDRVRLRVVAPMQGTSNPFELTLGSLKVPFVVASHGVSNVQPVTTGNGQSVVINSIGGTLRNSRQADRPAAAPLTMNYPLGFFAFDINDVPVGGAVTVVLNLPEDVTPDSYLKCVPSGCEPFAGAVITGNIVELTLVDGGAGDADGTANGTILDPGAPVGGGSSSSTASGGGGGSLGGAALLVLMLLGLARQPILVRPH